MSTPQSVRAREIVRGVDVEEQELRIAEAPNLGQREDTDRDALVEADGAEVAGIQGGGDGVAAGGTVGRAERLHAPASVAFGEHGVVGVEPAGERLDQRHRHEGHVPGDAHDRRGPLDDRSVDPAEGAEPRADIGHHSQAGSPRIGVRRVGHEQRRLAQSRGERIHQPVEDPLAADRLQAFRPAAEAGGPTACQDRAADLSAGQ